MWLEENCEIYIIEIHSEEERNNFINHIFNLHLWFEIKLTGKYESKQYAYVSVRNRKIEFKALYYQALLGPTGKFFNSVENFFSSEYFRENYLK